MARITMRNSQKATFAQVIWCMFVNSIDQLTCFTFSGLFSASGKAGFITGENICIDGAQTCLMIYHGDHDWTLNA